MSLLEETKDCIKSAGKKPEDIIFIGSLESGYSCTWDEFIKLADFEYDSGYGGAEVATDLRVVFKDMTYMSRGEYDGSEWWDYQEVIKIPTKVKPIKTLKGGLWGSLKEVDEELEELV